jgi:putative ABC transport system substrate-binding protein
VTLPAERLQALLVNFTPTFLEGQARVTALVQVLQKLGWIEGGNIHIDIRWAADDPAHYRRYSEELVGLAPDVILAGASPSVAALQRVTRSMPIVFAGVIDPVGAGFVNSLARPGGNATGFAAFEYSISGKWLELLKEIAPGVKRVGFLQILAVAAGPGEFGAMQSAAPSLGLEVRPINVRDAPETERAVAAFARPANGGLIAGGAGATWGRARERLRYPELHHQPGRDPARSSGPATRDHYHRADSVRAAPLLRADMIFGKDRSLMVR